MRKTASSGGRCTSAPFAAVVYPAANALRKMIILSGSSPALAALTTPFRTPNASNSFLRMQLSFGQPDLLFLRADALGSAGRGLANSTVSDSASTNLSSCVVSSWVMSRDSDNSCEG